MSRFAVDTAGVCTDQEAICSNCGDDLVCEGYAVCSDCMDDGAEPELCQLCGREADSFGCKIRHVSMLTGWAASSH